MLLRGVDEQAWKDAIVNQNLLQARNPATAIRLGRLIRKRLELMGADLWRLVKDGSAVVATHAALAAAVKHSALLGDFLDLVVRDQYRLFAKALTNKLWDDYLDDCRGRDPDMPLWNESTRRRLRSSVFQILAQAGYIDNTKPRTLQTVHVADQVVRYLKSMMKIMSSVASRWPHERCPQRTTEPRSCPGSCPTTSWRARASATRSPSTSSTTRPKTNFGVREHVRFLLEHIPKQKPGLRVKHINLFDFVLDYLKEPQAAGQAAPNAEREGRRGPDEGPRAPLHETKVAQVFAEVAQPDQHDLVLVSGVGSVWPLLRSHSLLNNLHHRHGQDAAGDVLPWPLRRQSPPTVRQAEKQQLLPGLQAGSVSEAINAHQEPLRAGHLPADQRRRQGRPVGRLLRLAGVG